MPENAIRQQILIITGSARPDDGASEPRRGEPVSTRLLNTVSVDITNLQGQVNIFLQQMNEIMKETPEKVGDFQLAVAPRYNVVKG